MRRGTAGRLLTAAALACVCGGRAGAADVEIPGRITIIKAGTLFKLVAKPTTTFPIPAVGGAADPLLNGGAVHVFDTDSIGSLNDALGAGTWKGLGSPAGSKGYKYTNTSAPAGGAVKTIVLKPAVMKILARDDGSLNGPIGGNLAVELHTGADRYCADFGIDDSAGTVIRNDAGLVKIKDAPAPSACPFATGCVGCNNHAFLSFSTTDAPGDCGDIIDAAGTLVANVDCAGLYTGGGQNSVPLPYGVPDQGSTVVRITSCTGSVATVGASTTDDTDSNLKCSSPGCLFGHPLAVPNAMSPPTSVCVINTLSDPPSGTVDCATGATDIDLPLSSVLFLTGDGATDPGGTIAGVQPCPLCLSGTCIGGPNDGMTCTPGTSALGGNPAYPTSHDCPPADSANIGTLPIAFALSSGTVQWNATPATNDTGSTASVQTRVFSGFCRDADLTGGFAGTDPGSAQLCWENGMAVGPACSGIAESCEQRNQGAFGPNGNANRTIRAIGNGMGILGGPASATLVSVFSIRPTFSPTVDSAGDLPGPGAVALPGTAQSCGNPGACP